MAFPKIVRSVNRSLYAHDALLNDGLVIPCCIDYEVARKVYEQLFLYADPETKQKWQRVNQDDKAYRKRVDRLKKRIFTIVTTNNEPTFITLTFTDEVLNETTRETRRKYVQRYLNNYNCLYVANIDFGELKGREHWHAVIGCRVDPSQWNYGGLNVQKIKLTPPKNKLKPGETPEHQERLYKIQSVIRLSKYVSKLTNHAKKATTKNLHIMYSRQFDKLHMRDWSQYFNDLKGFKNAVDDLEI